MATLTDDMKAYIAHNLGYLATVDENGEPDLGPKMSLRVLDDHRLIYNEMTGKTIMKDRSIMFCAAFISATLSRLGISSWTSA